MSHSTLSLLATSLLACLAGLTAHATHLNGAEIHYSHLSGFTYKVDVHLYSDLTITAQVPIAMGDGSTIVLPLVQVDTLGSLCSAYRLVYSGTHTYAGPGAYTLQVELVSRPGSVLNIPDPVIQPLCVTAELLLSPVNGANNSVVFASYQTDVYHSGAILMHDLIASDPDGDSLSFAYATPRGTGCAPLNPYYLPHIFGTAPDISWIDAATGTFSWDYPYYLGNFIIAIQCTERRNGVVVGRVTRDMLLCVNTSTSVSDPGVPNQLQVLATGTPGIIDILTTHMTGERIEVCDLNGRILTRSLVSGTRTQLDLGTASPGMYLVRINSHGARTAGTRFILGQ